MENNQECKYLELTSCFIDGELEIDEKDNFLQHFPHCKKCQEFFRKTSLAKKYLFKDRTGSDQQEILQHLFPAPKKFSSPRWLLASITAIALLAMVFSLAIDILTPHAKNNQFFWRKILEGEAYFLKYSGNSKVPWAENKDNLSSSDSYQIVFKSYKQAYIYICKIDSQRKFSMIFPAKNATNQVTSGQWLHIPSKTQVNILKENVQEHIYFFISKKPWENLEQFLQKFSLKGKITKEGLQFLNKKCKLTVEKIPGIKFAVGKNDIS